MHVTWDNIRTRVNITCMLWFALYVMNVTHLTNVWWSKSTCIRVCMHVSHELWYSNVLHYYMKEFITSKCHVVLWLTPFQVG